jgi:YVTN family beta-propeller protein
MKSGLLSSDVCTKSHNFKPLLLILVMLISIAGAAQSRLLVTGKSIFWPPLGVQQNVGSLPMNMVLSPDGKYALVSDIGFDQSLTVINTKTGGLVSNLDYPNCNYCGFQTTNGLYYGIAFGSNGTVYAAQGGNNSIDVLNLASDGIVADLGSFTATQPSDFPSGLATDTRGYLYVVNNDPATFALPSSVAIYSQATQKEVGRYSFTTSWYGTPNFPLAVAVLSNGSKAYVSSERDGAVYDLNTSDPTNPTLTGSIATGANPDGLVLNQAQTFLYVANAGSDTVSVIRTADDTVVNTIVLRPAQLKNVAGSSTPTGLGLSPNGKTLYVALGDMNAVAVLGVNGENLALQGYIPTGWYPTSVVAPTANSILFANGKGTITRYPNPGYIQWAFNSSPDYDQHLIQGQVSLVTGLSDEKLTKWTRSVLANSAAEQALPDHRLDGLKGKIKHIIYIAKENRTYDQVLGDVPGGNGDPTLTLFGANVTPNLHALAERFVLLDNFYTNSEVSFDGWGWLTQGEVNEDLIKDAPYNYSGRGRNYDVEGQNNGYDVGGFPAKDPDGNVISPVYFPNGAPTIPDVTEAPGGHIWDAVQAAKITYRNYGFFLAFGVNDTNNNVIMPDNYPSVAALEPPGHDLAGVTDWDYRRFDSDYPDSDASTIYTGQGVQGCSYLETGYGKYNSPSRYSEWVREFNEMLAQDSTGATVPAFMTVRLPHDHTQGPTSGKFTPAAEVADNDYGVGQLVQAISQSPIWNNTAIFVIEDDSQDGPDHVDCHRSTAYVISPWIKQSSIDHEFHNTTSILKTMEMLLGLQPLTSYDAVANPIMDWDTKPGNNAPFTATLPAQSIICSQTPHVGSLSASDPRRGMIMEAGTMDMEHPDSAPARRLNELIWKSVKGVNSQMPAPRNTLGLQDSDGD